MYTKHTLLLHLSIFMVMSLAREARSMRTTSKENNGTADSVLT